MQHTCHLTWQLEEELHHHLPLSYSPLYLLQWALAQGPCTRCSRVLGDAAGGKHSYQAFIFLPQQNEKKLNVGTRWRQEICTAGITLLPLPLSLSENQKLASPSLKKSMTPCSPPASFLTISDTYRPKKQLKTWQCTMRKSFLRTFSGEMVALWS